jgi:hypothetical protein
MLLLPVRLTAFSTAFPIKPAPRGEVNQCTRVSADDVADVRIPCYGTLALIVATVDSVQEQQAIGSRWRAVVAPSRAAATAAIVGTAGTDVGGVSVAVYVSC